jgi:hypothetical protein
VEIRWIATTGVKHFPDADLADALRDVNNRTPVPKLDIYPDHHYSAINGLARGSDGLLHFQPLKTFLTPRMLWTVFGPANATMSSADVNHDLDIVRDQVDLGEICPANAFDLIPAIRSVMLRGQEELIGGSARRVADLEGRVMTHDPVAAEMVLQDLFELRHDLQTIRINAAQAYEVYDNLLDLLSVDETVMRIDTKRLALMRQQYGHLKNSADLEREYLQEVLRPFPNPGLERAEPVRPQDHRVGHDRDFLDCRRGDLRDELLEHAGVGLVVRISRRADPDARAGGRALVPVPPEALALSRHSPALGPSMKT